MTPKFSQSIQIHRPTGFGNDGRLLFSGTPLATVSGVVFQRRVKQVVGEGEVFEITAVGFMPAGTDVQRRDHLVIVAPALVSGQRFEVYGKPDAIDCYSTQNHVGLELMDSEPF